MAQLTDGALREGVGEDDASRAAALAKRDAALRAFHAAGWRPVDLQRVTGYSRETIRQALHPQTRLAENSSGRKSAGPPSDYVPYGERKRYVTVDSLAELHGPIE